MAERRMFAKTIISSDAFLDMPTSARLLYYDLGMRADDDGFINSPRSIMRMTGSADDDMKLLITKKFVIPFESGIIVIKHWNINNYIQKDRYSETKYKDEKAMLELDENKAYRLPGETKRPCIQSVYNPDTQVRLGKDRIEQDRLGEVSIEDAPAPRKKYGEYGWVKLTDEEHQRLMKDLGQADLDRCIKHIDESAQTTSNKNKWRDWNLVIRKCSREQWGVKNQQKTGRFDALIKAGREASDRERNNQGQRFDGIVLDELPSPDD